MTLRLIVRHAINRHGYNVWLLRDDGHAMRFAQPVEFTFGDPKDDSFLMPEPTLFLPLQDFNMIADSVRNEMIANGLQPSAALLEGELKATKYHLNDMRRLVFDTTGEVKP